MSRPRWWSWLSACLVAGAVCLPAAHAEEAAPDRVQVTDPYLELHTGPGRGYPVFFVAAREEWIEITLRHTDWYKVRTAGGKEGWVVRSQLETTLTDAGSKTTFRDIVLDDYLHRRVELGASWGRFKSEPMLKFWGHYKLSESIAAEATIGQVQGVFSGTDFWHVNLAIEPWSDQAWSPFFGVGLGKFKNIHQREARQRPGRLALSRQRTFCLTHRLFVLHRVPVRHPQRRVPRVHGRPFVLLLSTP